MSSLLLHVEVEVDTMGYGICISHSMSPIPERLKLLYSKMWMHFIQKAKDGCLDVIESYIFWNMHELK